MLANCILLSLAIVMLPYNYTKKPFNLVLCRAVKVVLSFRTTKKHLIWNFARHRNNMDISFKTVTEKCFILAFLTR